MRREEIKLIFFFFLSLSFFILPYAVLFSLRLSFATGQFVACSLLDFLFSAVGGGGREQDYPPL